MKVTRQNALSTNEDGLTKEEVDAQRTDFSYDSSSEEMVWDEDKGAMVPKPAPAPAPAPAPQAQAKGKSSRGVKKVNPNGIVQTGTQTGVKGMPLK